MKAANRCPSRNRVLPGKLAAVAGWSFFGSLAAKELARHQVRIARILRGRQQLKIRPRVLLLLPCGARLDHAPLRAAFAHARRTRWEQFANPFRWRTETSVGHRQRYEDVLRTVRVQRNSAHPFHQRTQNNKIDIAINEPGAWRGCWLRGKCHL